jgi:hypothetical protein
MNISIQLYSVYYDTCNWGNNSLDFEIKLLNNAKLPIYYKSEIYFWDDSGFGSENYQVDNMARINPNKFGILKIHIRNTKRWHFNRQGYYRISYNNKEVNVPISLKIMYKPINCSMTYEERMKTEYPGDVIFYDMFNQRFAELIVKECADIALREDHDPYECIKSHFGVK